MKKRLIGRGLIIALLVVVVIFLPALGWERRLVSCLLAKCSEKEAMKE